VGYWLGAGIASLVNIFDPQAVILGGGLVVTGELLLAPTRGSFERFVFARPHRKLPALALAQMGTDAGLIGAALLALHQYPDPLPWSLSQKQRLAYAAFSIDSFASSLAFALVEPKLSIEPVGTHYLYNPITAYSAIPRD